MRRIVLGIATAVQTLFCPIVQAATSQADIDQAWNKGLSWVMKNQHGDGGWSNTPGLGIQATSEVIKALGNINLKSGYTYMGAISWLSNAEPASVDSLARKGMALKAADANVSSIGNALISWSNSMKAWGAYPQFDSGLPDTPLAITALMDIQSSGYSNEDLTSALCQILPAQLSSPSYLWPYAVNYGSIPPSGQNAGAIIPTVYALQALDKVNTTPGRLTSILCPNGTYTINTVISNAINGLMTKRKVNNGFGDGSTSTILETALVYQVLKKLKPTDSATAPALDFLLSQQGSNGSWQDEPLQTALTLASLPPPTPLVDTDRDGIPDGVETALNTNPAATDSRFLALGAGSMITQPMVPQLAAARPAIAPSFANDSTLTSMMESNRNTSPTAPWKEPFDIELFIAGSTAQLQVLDTVLRGLFRDETTEFFHDDGGVKGANQGLLFRAYSGIVAESGPESLAGERLLVHFSGKGGSYSGVGPVAKAAAIERMVLNGRCTDPDGDHLWSCPRNNTIMAVPDAGLSEAPPSWHTGVNSPPNEAPPDEGELSGLDAEPIGKIRYGVATTQALKDAGLNSIDHSGVAAIISGTITDWRELDDSLPRHPVIVCRQGNGAQPAVNAIFLNIPCEPLAVDPAPEGSSLGQKKKGTIKAPGSLVVENGTPTEIGQCLNKANDGGLFIISSSESKVIVPPGGFALGIFPLKFQPQADDHWSFIDLNDENGQPVIAFQHNWMQWRDADPVTSDALFSILREIRLRLTDLHASEADTSSFSGMDSGSAETCGEANQ